MNTETLFAMIEGYAMKYGIKVVMAIILLVVGLWVVKFFVNFIDKALKKNNVDDSLRPFLTSVVGWGLKLALVIAVANNAGIQTTSFIALLGAGGLAVGMALQGSLANFAGGVLILLLKPFKVGDVVTAQGYTGAVDKITTFCTYLRTPDNIIICLPNGSLANSPIENITQEPIRRVDHTFGIDYGDDIAKARNVLKSVIEGNSKILKDPGYEIHVGELADSSVNFTVRSWVKTEHFWDIHFGLIEAVKLKFDEEKISFPFPQTDVHLYKQS